jgi:serine/threonine-protein kinase
VVALTTLGLLALVKVIGIALAGFSITEFLSRLGASIAILSVYVYLRRSPSASLRTLRICELAIGVAVIVESKWVMVAEIGKRVSSGMFDELPVFFLMFSFVYSILIAIYGMYVPNNWRRTAFVTLTVALIPSATALVLCRWYPAINTLEFPGFAAPLLTVAMALVATQAAHVVHQIRREVEKVKQYGQYQLLEEIGRGGMGVVYKAKHRMLKRPAAIKLIRSELATNPAMLAEFEHEVQLSATLTHWNSVQIYDYGRTDDGDFFYVMEHLVGESLHSKISREERLEIDETINIVSQVCSGLAEAHSVGMVHRDIKPDNIFLTKTSDGSTIVKILDFGLASMKSDTERLQKVSGTPSYISPEQIRSASVDERSDIYALGCVLFECLTGSKLFSGDSISDLLDQHVNHVPNLNRLSGTASSFADIVRMCVEKNPDDRFKNVAAVKNAISKSAN